ncbi:MAG TPA: acyl-CoA dehydrogenase family protein, partial [Planctomycetaceae bacterium]
MTASTSTPKTDLDREPATFVETALKLAGKSAEEARTTGTLDRADEQVEKLFATKYQTTGSPVYRAVWDDELPGDVFVAKDRSTDPATHAVMQKSLDLVRERRNNKTLCDAQGKVSPESLAALSEAGYFGLLVDREYGGQAVSFQSFAKFLTQMATVDATVAGLASVHGCIGAVDPLRTFGSPEQKQRFLPLLASGKRLSAFALTEP